MAWSELAAAGDEMGIGAPRMYEDSKLEALYQTTRREILRWMKARARGEMRSPPGGVGGHK